MVGIDRSAGKMDKSVYDTNGDGVVDEVTLSRRSMKRIAAASDTLRKSEDTEVNHTSYEVYENCGAAAITIPSGYKDGGTFRVKFDLKNSLVDANKDSYGVIYKNNVLVGTPQVVQNDVYATKSEDLAFNSGDVLTIFTKEMQETGSSTYVRNFRVYTDNSEEGLSEPTW